MIVTSNGYILTNEHVSGSKYSNCYVTLTNGKNIYPQELEFLLNKLPSVEESMVFARNKDSMDTTLCAKIVYNKDGVKELYGDKSQEELKEIFWQKVKRYEEISRAK